MVEHQISEGNMKMATPRSALACSKVEQAVSASADWRLKSKELTRQVSDRLH
jgi:hypothetical protein